LSNDKGPMGVHAPTAILGLVEEILGRHEDFVVYVQQDATLHSLFYLETALHVSGGTITHHQERKQLCLLDLVFVAYATQSTLELVPTLPR